jgi:hypothetical protein
MDHYEVRKFPGWHHHMITCMLGHFFLWHLKLILEKKHRPLRSRCLDFYSRACLN